VKIFIDESWDIGGHVLLSNLPDIVKSATCLHQRLSTGKIRQKSQTSASRDHRQATVLSSRWNSRSEEPTAPSNYPKPCQKSIYSTIDALPDEHSRTLLPTMIPKSNLISLHLSTASSNCPKFKPHASSNCSNKFLFFNFSFEHKILQLQDSRLCR
jgi:hypothetical protein